MDIIIEYVREITIYIILMEFILITVPENSYKGYIRLIIGSVLIIIVLKPIYSFFEVLG